jgi:hypothetical protein
VDGRPIVVPPGQGHRVGNVEFLARTADPPGVEHGFRNDQAGPVRMLNIHAPAGFDRRIGIKD